MEAHLWFERNQMTGFITLFSQWSAKWPLHTSPNFFLFLSCLTVFSQKPASNYWRCVWAATSLPAREAEKHAGGAGGGHGSHTLRHRAQDPTLQPAASRRQGRHPDTAGEIERDGPSWVPGGCGPHVWEVGASMMRKGIGRIRAGGGLWNSGPRCSGFLVHNALSPSFVNAGQRASDSWRVLLVEATKASQDI